MKLDLPCSKVDRRIRLALATLVCSVLPFAAGSEPLKVLRVAFPLAEDGFDPARVSDSSSYLLASAIFESLYEFDYLAVPPMIRPLLAVDLPEASPDFRTWTIRVRPGIYFAPDPVFKGRRRELVAADAIYNLKRLADPAVQSPLWSQVEGLKIKGLKQLRLDSLGGKGSFDYDHPIEGLREIDRYTFQVRMHEPQPRLTQYLVGPSKAILAREVVEAYGKRTMEHPVGTGPFRLESWRRSSQIVLTRNPDYRDVRFEAYPAPNDAEAVDIERRLRGRRLPMVDRVEISVVVENQPRWLMFVGGGIDQIEVPSDFLRLAAPGGRIAPYLERRGVKAHFITSQVVGYLYFNMQDPVVGGYTPDKVALRRAISLGIDVERSIRLVRGGYASVAQSPISANLRGFDPAFRSEGGEYDPRRANALLDLYGYVDHDGDGWRDLPDGGQLVLRMATDPSARARQQDELFRRDMTALGLRVEFQPALWQENAKNARAGKLMMWQLAYGAFVPDGLDSLTRLYGPASGGFNLSRFNLPEFNAVFDNLLVLPDGAERDALFDKAKRLVVSYAPEKTLQHRVQVYMTQPWLIGYRENAFGPGWYQMVDIDLTMAPRRED